MDERKKLCGEAVREIIKVLAGKGLNYEEARSVLSATACHFETMTGRIQVKDTSAEINTNFINCNF